MTMWLRYRNFFSKNFILLNSYKEASILLFSRIGIGFAQILNIRVISELVDPKQIGLFNYVLSVGMLLSALTFTPLSVFVHRSFLVWLKNNNSKENIIYIIKIMKICLIIDFILLYSYFHSPKVSDDISIWMLISLS